jgi:hypothetical protein
MSRVTENASAAGGVSVTPKCQGCGAKLIRKLDGAFGRMALPYRKGTRWCSNACRQKAYRSRQSTSGGGA